MTEVIIEKEILLPLITYNNKTNTLYFEGRSFPENVFKEYEKLFDWLTNKNLKSFNVIFKMDYLNTSSTKIYIDFLLLYKNKFKSVKWYYNEGDDEILDLIEFFENVTEFKIEAIIIPTEEKEDFKYRFHYQSPK